MPPDTFAPEMNRSRAIALAGAGLSTVKIAKILGLTPETLALWYRRYPEMRLTREQVIADIRADSCDRVRALTRQALDTVVELLNDDDSRVRLEAATRILQAARLLGPQAAVQINLADTLTDVQLEQEIQALRTRLAQEAQAPAIEPPSVPATPAPDAK